MEKKIKTIAKIAGLGLVAAASMFGGIKQVEYSKQFNLNYWKLEMLANQEMRQMSLSMVDQASLDNVYSPEEIGQIASYLTDATSSFDAIGTGQEGLMSSLLYEKMFTPQKAIAAHLNRTYKFNISTLISDLSAAKEAGLPIAVSSDLGKRILDTTQEIENSYSNPSNHQMDMKVVDYETGLRRNLIGPGFGLIFAGCAYLMSLLFTLDRKDPRLLE
jgi:hypothetical protein